MWRSWLKRFLVDAYCYGLLPACVVEFVFRHVDLRAA